MVNTKTTRCQRVREPSTGNKRYTQKHGQGYGNGSAVKDAHHQARRPEFDPQDRHVGKTELTLIFVL